MTAGGTVREWHVDDGWGIVDVASLASGIWVHFSVVQGRASAQLVAGETVTVDWEHAAHPPLDLQATLVVPDDAGDVSPPAEPRGPSAAMTSSLTIGWDDSDDSASATSTTG